MTLITVDCPATFATKQQFPMQQMHVNANFFYLVKAYNRPIVIMKSQRHLFPHMACNI